MRSCIANRATGERRLELPRAIDEKGQLVPNRLLHLCADRGSKAWPGFQWILDEKNVSGSLWGDPLHDDWNGLQSASAEADVWLAWLERAVVLNLPFGPWRKDAFFQDVANNGPKILQELTIDDEAFQELYPRIALEMGLAIQPSDDPTAHKLTILEKVRHSPLLSRRGKKVRMGRWFSVCDRSEERKGELMPTLLVLLHLGVRRGFWPCMQQSPLFNTNAARAQNAAAAGEGEAAAMAAAVAASHVASQNKKETVAGASRRVEQLRKESANKLDLVTRILSNHRNFSIMEASLHVVQPVRISFGQWREQLHTQQGCLYVHSSWALDWAQSVSCHEAFQRLRGGQGWLKLGFAPSRRAADESTREKDGAVAKHMLRFAISLNGFRLANKLQFSRSLPGMFVLLVSDDQSVVQRVLERLHRIWDALLRAEELEHVSHICALWLKAIPWRRSAWVRSVLVRLYEYEWRLVPKSVQDELFDCFAGQLTTDMCENGFRIFSSLQASNSKNGLKSRQARWSALRQSDLMEQYDRTPLPVSSAMKTLQAQALPSTSFDADVRNFSIGGMTVLNELSTSDWVSANAHAWRSQGFAIEAMLAASDAGHDQLHSTWRSLLLPSGCGVTFANTHKSYLCLHSTRWGCILWRLKKRTAGEFSWFEPKPVQRDVALPWQVHCFSDMENVRLWDCNALPPCEYPEGLGNDGPSGVIIVKTGRSSGAAAYASRRAFFGINLDLLRELASDHGVDIPPRAREKQVIMALVAHFNAGLSQEELDAIVAMRAFRPDASTYESDLLKAADAAELVEGVWDENDAVIVADAVAKKSAGKAGSSAGGDPASGSGPGGGEAEAAGSAGGAPAKIKITDLPAQVTPDWSRTYVPKGKGVSLTLDNVRHHRWCASYLIRADPDAPRYFSRNYGKDEINMPALQSWLLAVQWLWRVHYEETQEVCPFDLDAIAQG